MFENYLCKLLNGRKKNLPFYLKQEKDEANINKEPWVGIINLDVDSENLDEGSFELDWNDIFIARLIKLGYKGRTDQELVDSWFNNLCLNVASETYEQEMSDPDKRKVIRQKQLENGRVEHF